MIIEKFMKSQIILFFNCAKISTYNLSYEKHIKFCSQKYKILEII